jgi:patatin-like phospholipase/acyl hydrolase
MRRVLALDGGGIRGVFTLEVLLRIQTVLREYYSAPGLVLADHFDLFAGTSTGAIIATCLCWGMQVEDILDLYVRYGRTIFTPVPWYRPFKKALISRYEAQPLSAFLQRLFSEDGVGKIPALLDSSRLRKTLLVVVRNHSTGSAWPLSNNPAAMFNHPSRSDSNLKVPIWQILRASTAAPVYFDPEIIQLGNQSCTFVDGAVTPYNNPALIAALMAVLPCYRMTWTPGPENIRIISIGTLTFSSSLPEEHQKLWLGYHASTIPAALIQGIAWQQDYLCRCIGECIYGGPLDSEVGDLLKGSLPGRSWFSYVRYNQTYKASALAEILARHPELARMDAVDSIPVLREIGHGYAMDNIQLDHLI